MKAIKLLDNFIEIPMIDKDGKVKHTLRFDYTDEAIKELNKNNDLIKARVKEMEKNTNEDNIADEDKEIVRMGLDSTFGEGTFDELYKINPTTFVLAVYFMQTALIIKEEVEKIQTESLVDKYIDG